MTSDRVRRMRGRGLLVLAFVTATLSACSAAQPRPVAAPTPSLGEPVFSEISPAVVPSNAVVDHSLPPLSNVRQYMMPKGVDKAGLVQWYTRYMPSGSD